MSGLMLTQMADWLRADGLEVVEWSGWQSRARSSGGFTGTRPWCVMWHHTASRSPIEVDAAYCATGSPDAPICNMLVARSGQVWLIAAGATNTNGKGYAIRFSRGTVPDDQMNTHAVGMEICNDGVGEVYPVAQVQAAFQVSLSLTARLGLLCDDAATHAAWAPDRKIDTARAESVQGGWQPRSINSSGTWNLDDLRAELRNRAGTPTPPPDPDPGPGPTPPPVEDDDMQTLTAALDVNGTIWIGDGITRYPVQTMDEFNNRIVLSVAGCYRLVNTNGQQIRQAADVREIAAVTLEALGRT